MDSQLLGSDFDQQKAEVFAESLLNTINSGAIALMISIGHRTRLFDVLADLPPSTSQEVAKQANLQERYVREWLNAMVVSRIVDYDTEHKTYYLPAERAIFLTRAHSSTNMATFFQYIPSLAMVEEQIVHCFSNGGGVPYAEFKRFHPVMAEDSNQTVVTALEDSILPLVPELIDKLQAGIKVLDVGCGSGYAVNKMAQLFPNSEFIGYDFSEEAIATAKFQSQSQNLSNVKFYVKDVTTLDELDTYDLITTFDAIHDQARPDLVLRNIYNALCTDGIYLMQDIHAASEVSSNMEHPVAPFLYTVSCMHCMTVSLAAGGMGLGTMWGQEKALQMLREAGFNKIEIQQLPHDIMNDYYIMYKG